MAPPPNAGDPPDDDFPAPGESTEVIKQRRPDSGVRHRGRMEVVTVAAALVPRDWWAQTRETVGEELANVAKPAEVVPANHLDRELGLGAHDFLRADRRNWLVRGHGEGMGHRVVDALKLSKVIELVAKTDFWISKSLYPGVTEYPGVQAAIAGSSAVLHMTSGIRELPVFVGDSQEYPTVAAGLYMAAMFGASTSENDLFRLMSPLEKGAVKRFTRTLDELAETNISLDAVVRPLDRANSAARRTSITPEEATEGARILRREPDTIVETHVVVGVLGSANAFSARFALAPDDLGARISGTYHPDLQPEVNAAYNRRVAATIETTRSEQEWMLGAQRPTHELVALETADRRPGHERRLVAVETLAQALARKRSGSGPRQLA
jgi:hypothetical protein